MGGFLLLLFCSCHSGLIEGFAHIKKRVQKSYQQDNTLTTTQLNFFINITNNGFCDFIKL